MSARRPELAAVRPPHSGSGEQPRLERAARGRGFVPGVLLAQRYRLGQLLGEGGMGQVWAARNDVTGRAVAIKRLFLPLRADEERHARSRFVLEARAACAVDHPNVVEIIDFLDAPDGSPLLVMERLHGETLASKLEHGGALDVSAAAQLLLPVVSAIGTAHARGIVHRDLKPGNIFVTCRAGAEPVVKVLDFGIAKSLDPRSASSQPCTRTGATLGTPAYMAPEQAVGAENIDHKADVWSLGVILYECLTGRRPIEGKNPADMVMQLLNNGITPIECVLPELRDDLASVIGRMLAQDPVRRPPDLREVFSVLQSCTTARAPAFGAPGSACDAAEADPEPAVAEAEAAPEQSGVRGRELATRTLDKPGPERARHWQVVVLMLIVIAAVLLAWPN